MNNFTWDFRNLKKDLEYDNVTYRRMMVCSVLLIPLVLAVCFIAYSSTLVIFLVMISVIVLSAGTYGIAWYALKQNKKDLRKAEENMNIVNFTNDSLIINGNNILYNSIVRIVKSDFKNSNVYNSSPFVSDGSHVFFLIEKNLLKSHEGAIKVFTGNKFDFVRVPLKYIVDAESFINTLDSLNEKLGLEYFYADTTHAIGTFYMKAQTSD